MSEERPPRVCEVCNGDGWFADERPLATPQGPSYGPDIRCTYCNGAGEVEDDSTLIEAEDLEVA